MSTTFVQVDAFTKKAYGGNPAAICVLTPERAKDDSWMQNVAAEMNLSETAFLVRRGSENGDEFNLRWFTPSTEVDLCGHATLASAHVLWQDGHLPRDKEARFHTRSGLLTANLKSSDGGEDWIEMDFPAERESEVLTAPAALSEALGLKPLYVGMNRMDYLFEVESEEAVRNLNPNFSLLETVSDCRGVIVTSQAAANDDYDFVSRFFAPNAGIMEDPVTGSAHCCLGPFWQKRLQKDDLLARQVSPRGGFLKVSCKGDRVFISGQAITTIKGTVMY